MDINVDCKKADEKNTPSLRNNKMQDGQVVAFIQHLCSIYPS